MTILDYFRLDVRLCSSHDEILVSFLKEMSFLCYLRVLHMVID